MGAVCVQRRIWSASSELCEETYFHGKSFRLGYWQASMFTPLLEYVGELRVNMS